MPIRKTKGHLVVLHRTDGTREIVDKLNGRMIAPLLTSAAQYLLPLGAQMIYNLIKSRHGKGKYSLINPTGDGKEPGHEIVLDNLRAGKKENKTVKGKILKGLTEKDIQKGTSIFGATVHTKARKRMVPVVVTETEIPIPETLTLKKRGGTAPRGPRKGKAIVYM